MSEIFAQVEGVIGERVIYVQFYKEDKPLENNLWKLTHPGNLEIEKWNSLMVKTNSKGEMAFDPTERTKKFFEKCVLPVVEPTPNVPLEKELIEKYGANRSEKPNPDTIHPRMYGAWKVLQEKFLSGSIWDDIDELQAKHNGERNPSEGKTVSKK